MRNRFVAVFITFIFSVTCCFANNADEPEVLLDTVLIYNNLHFRVKRISYEEFETLYEKYSVALSKPVKDMGKIKEILGKEFQIDYYTNVNGDYTDYILTGFRKGNKFRLLICETDGLIGYYPHERIMMYFGGHSSDQAFYVDTGEDAYNPRYSAFSRNRKYCITGLHSGQDNVDYRIQKYDSVQKQFFDLCELSDISRQIPYEADLGYMSYVFDQFWVDNTLYFRTGFSNEENNSDTYRYVAITIPE